MPRAITFVRVEKNICPTNLFFFSLVVKTTNCVHRKTGEERARGSGGGVPVVLSPPTLCSSSSVSHLNFVLGGAALLLVLLGEEAAHLVNEVFEELQFCFFQRETVPTFSFSWFSCSLPDPAWSDR